MLPSKGYFKSLNCPFFDNGFCDRPHCHFRHTRRDKPSEDMFQFSQIRDDQISHNDGSINDIDIFSEEQDTNSFSWPTSHPQLPATVSYKPTPLSELRKRHIPVPTVEATQKSRRKIESQSSYTAKTHHRQEIYVPEASHKSISTICNSAKSGQVYRATKISDTRQNDADFDIDYDDFSTELNDLVDILKNGDNGSEKVESSSSLLDLDKKSILNVSKSNCLDDLKTSIMNKCSDCGSIDDKAKIDSSEMNICKCKTKTVLTESTNSRNTGHKYESGQKSSSVSSKSSTSDNKTKTNLDKPTQDKSKSLNSKHSKDIVDTGSRSQVQEHTKSSSNKPASDITPHKHSHSSSKKESKHETSSSKRDDSKGSSKSDSNHRSSSKPSIRKESPHKKSSNDREKERHKSKKKSDSYKISKHKEKRNEEEKSSGSTEKKPREKTKTDHSSEKTNIDVVEVTSDTESVIVIDSDGLSSDGEVFEELGVPSPPFPVASIDPESILDHRVKSKTKTRVSLGNVWRPTTKTPVKILTPFERRLLTLRQKNNGEEEVNQPGPVRIGCVPNAVKLLEEKKRLLQATGMSTVNVMATGPTPASRTTTRTPSQQLDKTSEMPTLFDIENCKISTTTRLRHLQKLFYAKRQIYPLHHPDYTLLTNQCTEIERECCENSKGSELKYKAYMNKKIKENNSQAQEFTLRKWKRIKPREAALFITIGNEEQSIYQHLKRLILTEKELLDEGYPRRAVDEGGDPIFGAADIKETYHIKEREISKSGHFICNNCRQPYRVDEMGLSVGSECSYHMKKPVFNRKRDEKRVYECCRESAPCETNPYHVSETRSLKGILDFKETQDPSGPEPQEGWGVYALDCEMVWTVVGQELGRVTVIDLDERPVLDTCVQPLNKVINYCFQFSGLTEEILYNPKNPSFEEVRNILLKLFNSKTILIGHSLENDLRVLRIIHNTVVDTAIMYKDGQRKRSLKLVAMETVGFEIQSDEMGHDSGEDALACLKLALHKVKVRLEKEKDKGKANNNNGAVPRGPPPVPRYRPNAKKIL